MAEGAHPKIDEALAGWHQGDCTLEESYFLFRLDPEYPLTDSAASAAAEGLDAAEEEVRGLMVITQSCDLVRDSGDRPFVEVCPLVEVNAEMLEEIRKGRRPRYAWVRGVAGLGLVADLDRVMTVEKAVVAGWQRTAGCETDADVRMLSLAVARKRLRFAFPDDFVEFVEGLRKRISLKHDKGSPEGNALRALREIRVRAAPSWDADNVELTFYFIRDEDKQEFNGESWDTFLDGWLKRIPDRGRFRAGGLVTTLDDITARDYVESDPLDLDHLSSARAE